MNTPAGWYPDPSDPSAQRYWDGSQWTAQTRGFDHGGNAHLYVPTQQR